MTQKYDELVQLSADLQAAVDAAQQRAADAIAALQAIIDAGTENTTDSQLQAVIDTLTVTKTDVEGT